MHPKFRRIIPVLLLLAVFAVAVWYLSTRRASAQTLDLTATGTIEAVEIRIAEETGGKIAAVLVREGERVAAGQELLRFDPVLLETQLAQAQAALAQAEANYALIAAGTPEEQRQAAVSTAQAELLAARQAWQTLQDTAEVAAARAWQSVLAAERASLDAQERLEALDTDDYQQELDDAWETVQDEQDVLEEAQEAFDRLAELADDNPSRQQAEDDLEAAQLRYDEVQRSYQRLDNARQQARAEAAHAAAAVAEARREFEARQAGPDPNELALAEARLQAAQARLEAALAGPSAEQLELAQAQIDQARATLEAAQARLSRAVVSAPADGVILNRLVEPGEVVAPGAGLFTLGQVDDLTITVFVPEDRYGTISLGEQARVTVDSYPQDSFIGEVVQIADRAEFTPRNVQTAESRRTTVFAVKLAVDNQDGRLKPGMPADVTFDR
jgi:HlyD family secretion protein